MFNSIFDVLTLSLIALKPTLRTVLTENVNDDYVYVYMTSCFLMCSDFTTLAALFERIMRLGGKSKNNTTLVVNSNKRRKHSYRFVILVIMVLSAAVNSPILYAHRYFEIEWFYKNVYFEMCLTPFGWSQFWAKFAYAIGLIINVAMLIVAIIFNSSIYKLMKQNASSLKQFIEIEAAKSGEFIINIGISSIDIFSQTIIMRHLKSLTLIKIKRLCFINE